VELLASTVIPEITTLAVTSIVLAVAALTLLLTHHRRVIHS
jgi:hypothetical protein